MRFSMILFVIIFVFLPLSDLYGGTIYSWTDENGIKKYSNTAPEEGVEHLEVIEEIPISETGDSGINVDEEELSHVIRELEVENRISELRTEQQSIKTEEEKNKIADDPFNEKIWTEKKRLQGEIDRIKKLAVGRSLSLARKNAMIKQFQDKLDLLEGSPEEYFSVNETE